MSGRSNVQLNHFAIGIALLGACSSNSTSPTTGDDAPAADAPTSTDPDAPATSEHFSFFVTSLAALQRLSGSQDGFGGDLRFGETGAGAGLRGADKICASIAETSMPGSGGKGWHAFLAAVDGGDGNPVNAFDRIGQGPWYDRLGRLWAPTLADAKNVRPANGDATIKNDFPNEDGVPNHQPDPNVAAVDNHDMLTGAGTSGAPYSATSTCASWTSTATSAGKPRVGHSWPRSGGGGGGPGGGNEPWTSTLTESGCAPGVSLVEMGPPDPNSNTVGSGGGYGGFYCFATTP